MYLRKKWMEGKHESDNYASRTGMTTEHSPMLNDASDFLFCRVPGLPQWLGDRSLILKLNSHVADPVPVNKIRSPRPLALGSAHVKFDLSV